MAGEINPNVHWRDSARQVRFFMIDYRATFPMLFLLLYPAMWLFVANILLLIFLFAIERYGYTTVVFARIVRGFIAGHVKHAIPWWRYPKVS